MWTYFSAFEVFFEENLPQLFAHFRRNSLSPDIYLIDWSVCSLGTPLGAAAGPGTSGPRNPLTRLHAVLRIFTLYSKSLPLDLACRVWDVFCRDGEEFLFRTALGLLRLHQDLLLAMDFIHMAQFLTRLPEPVPGEQLFQHIAAVHMSSRNRKWAQVGRRGGPGLWVVC